ncbi:MAG: sigma-70 family RNA polymerase sigma factor [Ardenticatenaceae bacterium]|nr:sigma-70 family RNA polymerase sigma factor [Ardenticatenaceae bacterium]MCB9445142.1 sigma-70 family RNA polymerase sigma factor [Ardenticatenaceae bacterium]
MAKRTNEQWLDELQSTGLKYDNAIIDLRAILVSGLRRGLLNQINTSVPEFETQAEDFAQEAVLKILDNLDNFAGRSQFTTWAYKIAVSVALTELRRKRWQDRSLDGIIDDAQGNFTPSLATDPAPAPENATERAETIAKVQQMIDERLTDKQRSALVAAIIEGLSTNELARQMKMKPNAVYKLLHDARLQLKKSLDQEGLTPDDILSVFE